jgi:hypothetical protein
MRSWCGALVLAGGLMLGTGCDPGVTDTGYSGTWQRLAGSPSSISLREGAEGWEFRWSARDAARTIVCTAAGLCDEVRDGKKVYLYRFRVFEGADDGGLHIECTGEPVDSEMVPMRYVDRLVVQPGGMELWSYMIEMNGEKLDEPRGPVRFSKTSDVPF